MNLQAVMIIANLLIGFIFIRFLRNQDYYHPEPLKTIALSVIIGGFISIVITLGVGFSLKGIGLYQSLTVANCYFIVGPLEEASKFIGFYAFIKLFKVEIDEPVDALIYISGVASGFGLVENFFYGFNSLELFGYRSFLTTPLHIVFSIPMALSYATKANRHKFKLNMLRAFLVSWFIHATYDALLVLGVRLGPYFILMFVFYYGKRIFGYALLNSPHRKSIQNSLVNSQDQEDLNCLVCQGVRVHKVYHFKDEKIHECHECNYVVFTKASSEQFLDYFLPYNQRYGEKVKKGVNSIMDEIHDEKYNVYKKTQLAIAAYLVEEQAVVMRQTFEASITYKFIFGEKPFLDSENWDETYRGTAKGTVDLFKGYLLVAAILLVTGAFVMLLVWIFKR